MASAFSQRVIYFSDISQENSSLTKAACASVVLAGFVSTILDVFASH